MDYQKPQITGPHIMGIERFDSIVSSLDERGLQVSSSQAERGHRALHVDLGVASVFVHVHFSEGGPRIGDETATVVYRIELFGATTAQGSFTAELEDVLDWLQNLFE